MTPAKFPTLTAARLFVMVHERGYRGSPEHFRHVIAGMRPRSPAEAFLRLRTLPGEQAQVDWGHFGHLQIGHARRPLMASVMVLSYSRRIFLRFFLDARMDSFLRGHVEALVAYGGCARVPLYDNLKSAVLERVGDAVRFNPELLRFALERAREEQGLPPPTALCLSEDVAHRDLAALDSDSAIRRRLRHYAAPDLLLVDEVGYLSYSNRHADLLFELVSRRYQHKGTVVTTNRAFKDWGEVFPNAACVVSLVDRLMHRAEVVHIEGESDRAKEAQERMAARTKLRAVTPVGTARKDKP